MFYLDAYIFNLQWVSTQGLYIFLHAMSDDCIHIPRGKATAPRIQKDLQWKYNVYLSNKLWQTAILWKQPWLKGIQNSIRKFGVSKCSDVKRPCLLVHCLYILVQIRKAGQNFFFFNCLYTRHNAEEKKLLNKVVILFSLCIKSILVA